MDSLRTSTVAEALERLEDGFRTLPEFRETYDECRAREVLREVAERLHDNYPYHHPLYCGQMLKPPHPIAWMAHSLAMFLNPNNHALDGGRASSAMEKEAVAEIAKMFGWTEFLGHLCGGGTMANFEALWVARELRPGKVVLASSQAHYTHSRLSSVLGLPFRAVDVDGWGQMNLDALEAELERGDVGTVVATLGTTAAGAVDPLAEILELCRRHDVRVHVDTAYGGYFHLIDTLEPSVRRAFDHLSEADSIVVDPHKHGLQPYGCGCVLFRDPEVGRFYRHDSPYTYFSSDELHLGEISLECSRAGAAAVALWATMRAMPLVRGGDFATSLERCRTAAQTLARTLDADERFAPLFAPQLDVVVWAVVAETASESSRRAREIFDAAATLDLHLALATFPRSMCERADAVGRWDQDELACLRACVMKPEHLDWMPRIVDRLESAAEAVCGHEG